MPKRNLAWILVVGMIALLMWQLPAAIVVRDSVYEAFGPLVEVRAEIHRRYVEDIDDGKLVDAAVSAGIKKMVEQLHDPHAFYMNAEEYDRFRRRTDGVFGGIGVDVWQTDEGLEVLSREPNSPAANAGILPGEIITHIDGRPATEDPFVEVINNLLNGPPGSEVTLTVVGPPSSPDRTARQVRLERQIIRLDPISGWSRTPQGDWRFVLDPQMGLAYIRLTKFTPDADERMDAVVNRLLRERLQGLILDLRDNTGGLFDSGIAVADRFLESGLLVRRSGRRSDAKEWYAASEGTYPHFEMAVLINGSSASAAEMVAGALGDHHRAAIIGERSYGKASVQEVLELERGHGGALKLTTAYYYLPSGRCIHRTPEAERAGHWGVEPTIPVTLGPAERRNLLNTWREVARELVPDESASQPHDAEDQAADEAQRAAEVLLAADPYLRTAVEYLRDRIEPRQAAATRSATSQAGSGD